MAFLSVFSVSEAYAACSITNNGTTEIRIDADSANSNCVSGLAEFRGTNLAPVIVRTNAQLRLTAPTLSITSTGNSSRSIHVNTGAFTADGDVTINHNTTSKTDATFNARNGATASIAGDLSIVSTTAGILAQNGSLIEVGGVVMVNSQRHSIHADGIGSRIFLTGDSLSVTTGSNPAGANAGQWNGLLATNGGSVVASQASYVLPPSGTSLIYISTPGASIATNGDGGHGLQARSINGDATIDVTDVTVTTGADGSASSAKGIYALVADGPGNASIRFSGGSVTTQGNDSDGLIASVDNNSPSTSISGSANVQMTDGTITTSGNGSSGIIAQTDVSLAGTSVGNATVIMQNGSISTSGSGTGFDGSYGIFATASGSGDATIEQQAGTVSTTGNNAYGLYGLSTAGNTNILVGQNASVSTSGPDADAVHALTLNGGMTTVKIAGTVVGGTGIAEGVNTIGNSSITIEQSGKVTALSGVAILGEGGNVNVQNAGQVSGDIRTSSGNDIVALLNGSITKGEITLDNGSDNLTISHTAEVSGVTLFEGGDDVYVADGFIDRLTVLGGVRTMDSASIVNWEQVVLENGMTTFSGTGLLTGGGGTAQSLPLGLYVGTGATLTTTEQMFEVQGDVTNSGTISISNGVVGDVFTIAVDPNAPANQSGNYSGSGGSFILDTFLAYSSAVSDVIELDGGLATGSTGLIVNNTGGSGALTTGDGILIVSAINGATTSSDAFFLSAPVAAGAFDYLLFRGGAFLGSENNWYLRSALNVRPEIPTDLLVPALAYYAGFTQLGTFHDRQGDQRLLGNVTLDQRPVWSRIYGEALSFKQDYQLSVDTGMPVSSQFDGSLSGIQFGVDLAEWETGSGNNARFGVFLAYTQSSGSVRSPSLSDKTTNLTAGNIDLTNTAIGAYLTVDAPSGAYLDVVGLYGWIDGSTHSNRGIKSDISGNYIMASSELGVRYDTGNNWSIEPQVQLIWQLMGFSDSTDSFSTTRYDNVSSLTGRIGVRLEKYIPENEIVYFVSADIWSTIGDNKSSVAFNNDAFNYDLASTSLELKAGATVKLKKNLNASADLNYSQELSSRNNNAVGVNTGLHFRW